MYYYKTEVGFQGFLREIDRLINNLILDNKFEENKFLNTWIREEAISKMKEIFSTITIIYFDCNRISKKVYCIVFVKNTMNFTQK